MCFHKTYFIVNFLVLFTFFCQAEDIEYKFIHKFSIKEGLSSYNIRKILKDEFGYVWIATQGGLNRFDGFDFIHYNPNERFFKINGLDIRDILLDSQSHRLWVLSNVDGIFSINTVTGAVVSNYNIPYNKPDDWSRCFKKIGNFLWISGFNSFKIFNTKEKVWLPDPLLPFTKTYNSSFDIGDILIDGKKNVLVFINGIGIVVYDSKTKNIIKFTSEKNLFFNGFPDRVTYNNCIGLADSSLLLCTNYGVVVTNVLPNYAVKNVTYKYKSLQRGFSAAYSATCNFKNDVYVGFENETIYTNKTLSNAVSIRDKDENSGNMSWLGQVRTLYDDGKFVWIGNKEGLAYFSKNTLSKEIYSSGTSEFSKLNHVYDIEPLTEKKLLVGEKNGLFLIDNKTKNCTVIKKGITVNNLFTSYDGNVLVATTKGSFIFKNKELIPLFKFYPELKRFQSNILLDNVMISDSVMAFSTDDDNGVIVWNFKSKKVSQIKADDLEVHLGSNTINGMHQGLDGSLWILSDRTITIINKQITTSRTITIFDTTKGKALGPIFDATETGDFVWLCCYGSGLIKLDKRWKILKIYNEGLGLTNDGVYKVFNYRNRFLFITSNNGLSVLDIYEGKLKRFYEEDGLHSNTFEEATGCFKNGLIYTGGPHGFSVIRPASFDYKIQLPVLLINKVSVKSDKQEDTSIFSNNLGSVTIPNSYSQTIVYFSALNYNSPLRTIFSYRIQELQKKWIEIDRQHFVSLIGLSPGSYTLEVKAANEDGYWSEPKQLTLIFDPKWYQTLSFKLSVALAVIALLYSFYRYRINQIRKQQQIRKGIASDLHDDLGSTLNSVKIFTELALTATQKEDYLYKIKDALKQASVGLRDMIWVLDDSEDTVEELVKRIQRFAVPVTNASNIAIDFITDNSASKMPLTKTEKRNLLLIAKEAINNSIKYAGCNSITVIASKKNTKTILTVKDDGKGFSSDGITPGNGLRNMQERAKQINYKFKLESSLENGTIITVFSK